MKFIKKNLKYIILIIIMIIIASSVSVYATAQYLATQIEYKDGKSVSSALDELYTKYNKYNTLTLRLSTTAYSDTLVTSIYFFDNNITEKYTHFKLINVVENEYVKNYQLRGFNKNTNSNETLIENTEYNTSDYASYWINLTGTDANLTYSLVLYN